MPYRQQLVINGTDNTGEGYQTFWSTLANPMPSLGAYGGLLTAYRALSLTKQDVTQLSQYQPRAASHGTGPYATVRDRAVIILRSTEGSLVHLHVSAPTADMFVTGTNRVNFANVNVIAFVAAAQSVLSDAAGNALVAVVSGFRARVER